MLKSAMVAVLLAVAAVPMAGAEDSDMFQINGYGSLEFEKQITDTSKGKGDKNGSFDADAFVLVMNFTPSKRFRVSSNLSWEHGPALEDLRGNVAVEYAFAEFYVWDALKIRAGKQLIPFGIYNEIHTAKPLFLSVKEPFSTNKIDKLGSAQRYYPRWGAGIELLGSGQIAGRDWDYVILVTNGDQKVKAMTAEFPNPFELDDNAGKAITSRVRFHPVKSITVGASLYYDSLEEFNAAGIHTGKTTTLASYGGQATWEGHYGGVELEYIHGHTETSSGVRDVRSGSSAMVWANLGARVRPYLRYEGHDPDSSLPDNNATIVLGGINLQIEHGLFIKTELDRVTAGAKNTRFKGQAYTEFKGSISYGF
jgi:hypothetical protein